MASAVRKETIVSVDAEAVAFVQDFVRSTNPSAESFGVDDDLVRGRLLDSLHFIEFLVALEERTGREIPLAEVNPEDFRTVRRIAVKFFSDPTETRRAMSPSSLQESAR